jgi:predicted nucleic acid-binding protein
MKLVVDSNILVSSFDPKDMFHSECYPVFERILSFEIGALSPALVLVETTCALRRRTNSEEIARKIYRDLALLPSINWLDITLEVAERACMLGAKT